MCVSVATRGTVPAYQALAETLRDRILSGELEPGHRLPVEPELSAAYGVSRSTVREALRVLASQNLVETTRGVLGGSFVAHPRPHQISSYLQSSISLLTGAKEISVEALLEARDLLEVPAAGLAALRRTRVHVEALEESLVDRGAADPSARHALGVEFHVTLLRSAGNPLLEVLARPVYGVLAERFDPAPLSAAFWAEMDDDHRRIVEAVRRRDVDGAREATRAHLAALRPAYALPPRPRGSSVRSGQDNGRRPPRG